METGTMKTKNSLEQLEDGDAMLGRKELVPAGWRERMEYELTVIGVARARLGLRREELEVKSMEMDLESRQKIRDM